MARPRCSRNEPNKLRSIGEMARRESRYTRVGAPGLVCASRIFPNISWADPANPAVAVCCKKRRLGIENIAVCLRPFGVFFLESVPTHQRLASSHVGGAKRSLCGNDCCQCLRRSESVADPRMPTKRRYCDTFLASGIRFFSPADREGEVHRLVDGAWRAIVFSGKRSSREGPGILDWPLQHECNCGQPNLRRVRLKRH